MLASRGRGGWDWKKGDGGLGEQQGPGPVGQGVGAWEDISAGAEVELSV